MELPKRSLSKSKFSMYLRTQCDRELYLSLFSNNPEALAAAGVPIPLKSRPGVQLITKSGHEFEYEQYDELIRAIPDHVIHQSNGRDSIDALEALNKAFSKSFVLQPQIEPENFREFALSNLGLSIAEQKFIPKLSGLKPDVLYIREPCLDDYEITPDGSRRRVEDKKDRLAISVVDLKNITEANASYSGEVCLYAFFLANWLASEGKAFQDRYFVCDRVYLWKHLEMPQFNTMLGLKKGADPEKRINALLEDLEDGLVKYLIYMPSVRKFFKEDIPRVVETGDTYGWHAVKYHVNPRCSSCDWLGNQDWLIGSDLKHYDNNPNHYCFHCAEVSDHLSKMPSLSKGASQILATGGHVQIKDLVGISPTADVLKKHAFLKKDRSVIGERATALNTETCSVDVSARVGGLARYLNAEYDIIVNFDSGTGMLTGVAVRGVLFAPYGQKFSTGEDSEESLRVLGEQAFVVPKDNDAAEWTALQSFMECLGNWIAQAEKIFGGNKWGAVKTQICFWELRQYEELCNAFGRHLLKILDLSSKHHRALAWIFPAEELMERDTQLAPGLVFIRDIVHGSVRLPVRFANTLLGAAGYYHHPNMNPRKIDKYYLEPLGNAVPRERIFEIWKSSTGTVRMYGRTVSILDAIQKYADVLKAHTWALASITRQLRTDLKNCIEGNAPALVMTIPQGLNSVAYDSKLWGQWEKVSSATAETEGRLGLITRAEWLEASYKAIVLTALIKNLGGHRYEFQVSEESTEAKLEEGDSYCAVGIVGWPGFPLQTGDSLGLSAEDPEGLKKLRVPLHKVVAATLEKFDRANQRAIVSFRPRSSWVEPVFNAVMDGNIIPIGTEPIYLLEGLPYDDSDATIKILREMGNPICANAANEALVAMGRNPTRSLPKGSDKATPIARILWDAVTLSKTRVRADAETQKIIDFAKSTNVHSLNDSQETAVKACVQSQLSVIWGPPGTGKTDTLVALLHTLVSEAQRGGRSRKILITGPNYRAVEELSERLLKSLNNDSSSPVDFFWVYSRSREPKNLPDTNAHLNVKSMRLEPGEFDALCLEESLRNPESITIVSTTSHIINKITEIVYGEDEPSIQPLFDLVIIDESSQVPVTLAMRPLSVLKPEGQVIVAGDYLQMPPIYSLEPPKGAEYLVGSILTYLLKRFNISKQELLINYRSNQDLVDYAKTLGYPAKLEAENKIKQLWEVADLEGIVSGMPSGLPATGAYKELLIPERRVTAFIHEDLVSSQANEVEAKLVAGLAYCIRHAMAKELYIGDKGVDFAPFTDDEFFQEGLGIVTPHKAQKSLVLKELRALFPRVDPERIFEAVDTVERFQGSERQTIIVSFAVGDTDIIEGEEAFLLQMERTNVAVSRAKAKCIILMPKSLAYHLPTDQKAAETAMAIKSYIEEFCAKRLPLEIDIDGERRAAEVRWH